MTALAHALNFANESGARAHQTGAPWSVEHAAAAVEADLVAQGYTISTEMDNPLPLRTQGAIEAHDILQKFEEQGFTHDEAFQLLKIVLNVAAGRG